MTEHRSDESPKKTAPPSGSPETDGSRERKQLILWLAVGGMTVVVAVLWALLLPLQIKEMKFGSMSDLADRWRVVRDENQPPTSFRETLSRIHDRLIQSSSQYKGATPAAPNTAAPAMDIARLREKLEEISENTLKAPENAAPKAKGTK